MVRKILGTISTRVITAFLSLVIILVNARLLGPDKVGTISLIILAITIIQMINNFIGGGALVYLLPRTDLVKLFIPSYIWSVITALAGTMALHLFHLIPEGYVLHVLILSLILSWLSVNFMILVGQERINAFNLINLLQVFSLFTVLLILLLMLNRREVFSYVLSLYVSYILAFAGSLIKIMPQAKWGNLKGLSAILKELFRYGTVMQLGNIFQFFNYRLSYYFIEFFLGRAALGVYSVGVQLSESIWLISRSIHMVQYTRIANEKDIPYATRLTISLAKISFLISLLCLVLLFVLLFAFFSVVFSPAFNDVKVVMLTLSLGILIFSVSIIISPFFSGIGKPHHNTISAAIGLVFTLLCGLVLIPLMGIKGAGIAATISYTMAALYQVIVFIHLSKAKWNDLRISKQEIIVLTSEIKNLLKKS